MRPRVFPAEDTSRRRKQSSSSVRFNEAAGIPRGRRCPQVASRGDAEASMRPRVFPAEDEHFDDDHTPATAGFNEAAGIPRGRRTGRRAGEPRRAASMRPRVFPAEDGPLATHCDPTMFTPASREVRVSGRTSNAAGRATGHRMHCNSSVFKYLPTFRALPGIPAAPERSLGCGGMRQTMTGSRRTAWNLFPRLTTRGSTPSATPMSTSTT